MCLYRRCIMRLAVLLCGWLASPVASAQKASDVTTDTLTIRFRLDSVRIDMDYADNLRNWQTFEERFKYRFEKHTSGEIQVDIFAGASPEGPTIHNYWLDEQRGLSIRRLIRERLGKSVGRIAVHNEAARWSAFYDAVAESNEPWRDEVLRIIDMEPSANGSAWNHREVKLRNLHDGKVWPVLLDKYLSPLRSGGTAIVSWRPDPCDTVIVRDTVMMPVQTIPQDTIHIVQTDEPAPVICWRPYVAFKTNMLFDALMTPNLEVEAPIGWSRWSVMAEWWTPWYRWHGPNKHNRCYELLTLGAELRYWFSRREALCPRLLTGHKEEDLTYMVPATLKYEEGKSFAQQPGGVKELPTSLFGMGRDGRSPASLQYIPGPASSDPVKLQITFRVVKSDETETEYVKEGTTATAGTVFEAGRTTRMNIHLTTD